MKLAEEHDNPLASRSNILETRLSNGGQGGADRRFPLLKALKE
jgi:hypothetical protein